MDDFKLNFLVIGFQKCGTSTLADYLSHHDEINFCSTKEPAFFLEVYHNLDKFSAYQSLFDGRKSGLKGEASTAYAFLGNSDYTAKALFDHNPNLKLIFIVRNPINRVLSILRHRQLNTTVAQDLAWRQNSLDKGITNSNYGKILDVYLKYFPKENISVIKFEDLISEKALPYTCSFLGISFREGYGLKKVNFTSQKGVRGKWFAYYKKYHQFFLQLPFSAWFRNKAKIILKRDQGKPINVKLIELTSQEKVKIETALKNDAIFFEKIVGYNYFDLNK